VSVISVLISALIGTCLGALSALKGGWVDNFFMRLVDVVYSFPGILVVVSLAAFLGPSIGNLSLCLSITGWASYARIIRAVSLSLVEREFVQAARAVGAGNLRIFSRHLFPNLVPTLIVKMTHGIGAMILAEGSLGFLGLGAPPGTPSWGSMLNQGREVMTTASYLVIIPASALVLTVLAFNFVGDAARDFLDPKMRT
jgi:peptide/nickel transport system permease protein